MIAFATGSITIQCRKTKAEVKAIMNVREEEGYLTKDEQGQPMTRWLATRVTIPSISETDVKHDPRETTIAYRLTNEEIEFRRKDVTFWSVSEAVDPPLIQEVRPGIAVLGR